MCGILGIYKKNEFNDNFSFSKEKLNKLYHRGPDNQNIIKISNKLIFGHTRLSIIDLSERSNQPMFSKKKDLAICFNGEIYNFLYLKKTFFNDVQFQTNSDTEILIHMFQKFGIEKTLKLIKGMYAFSIYDKKKSKIYLARDFFGEKPLYYFHSKDQLIFSSSAAIVSKYQNEKKINIHSLQELISKNYSVNNCIFENVSELPNSSFLEFDLKNSKIKLEKIKKNFNPINSSLNYNQIKKQIKNRLIKSIEEKLYADVPIGIFLSGGIDSTLIAVLAKKYLDVNLSTYTVDFDIKNYSEGYIAKKTAEDLNLKNKQIKINPKTVMSIYSNISHCFDVPIGDMATIPNYEISRLAHKDVKVVLSGDGGDELFFGYNRYVYGQKIINLLNLNNKILNHSIISFLKILSNLFKDNIFKFNEFRNKSNKFISALNSKNNFDFYENLLSNFKENIFNTDYKINNNNLFLKDFFNIQDIRDFDLNFYLPKNILVKTDRTSMWHSLEVRSPYLDEELLHLANFLMKNFPKKIFLNKFVLKDILIEEYPSYKIKNKKGLGVPLVYWLRNELKDWSSNIFQKFQYYDELNLSKIKVSKILDDHYKNNKDYSNTIWTLLMLFKWYECSFVN